MTKEEIKWLDDLKRQYEIPKKEKVIVFGYEYWKIGGVERVLLTIMGHLKEKYSLFLFVPQVEEKLCFYEIPSYVEVIEFRKNVISLARQMAIMAFYVNAELFIGNGNLNVEFLNVYKELKKFGIKSIMLNHYFWLFPYMHEAYLSKVIEARNRNMKYPDKILGLTNISSYLCSVSSGREVETIGNPNCFDKQDRIPLECRENIVLTVGRFDDPIKRLDVILRIFSKLFIKDGSIKLVIVGTVKYKETFGKEIQDELKKLGLPKEKVCIVGEQRNVEQWYQRAKVFLFASEMEGVGLVLNEAGSFGIPIVSNYYLGIEDIIVNGENGYLFEAGVKEAEDRVVVEMFQLLHNKEIWDKMSLKAYEMTDRFSEKRIMRKWEDIINRVLQGENGETLSTKYIPSQKEYVECIRLYEKFTGDIIKRVNRGDTCQEFLNALYLEEKARNIEKDSLRNVLGILIKRMKNKIANLREGFNEKL